MKVMLSLPLQLHVNHSQESCLFFSSKLHFLKQNITPNATLDNNPLTTRLYCYMKNEESYSRYNGTIPDEICTYARVWRDPFLASQCTSPQKLVWIGVGGSS